jgi:hypothetical protein
MQAPVAVHVPPPPHTCTYMGMIPQCVINLFLCYASNMLVFLSDVVVLRNAVAKFLNDAYAAELQQKKTDAVARKSNQVFAVSWDHGLTSSTSTSLPWFLPDDRVRLLTGRESRYFEEPEEHEATDGLPSRSCINDAADASGDSRRYELGDEDIEGTFFICSC